MAALTDADRAELHADFMRRMDMQTFGSCPLTKSELRAAVDAMDAWIVANAASLNTAIPQPARGALNGAQKAMLFSAVVERRYVKGA